LCGKQLQWYKTYTKCLDGVSSTRVFFSKDP